MHNSKGQKKVYAPANYIKITLENEIGLFTMQFIWKDEHGNELTRIVDVTDDDLGKLKPLVREIQFVHEVYFSILTATEHKIVIGHDIGKNRQNIPRKVVKVILVNGHFATAYPVAVNPISIWLKSQMKASQDEYYMSRVIQCTLQEALDKTVRWKLKMDISLCMETAINAWISAEKKMQARGIEDRQHVQCQSQRDEEPRWEGSFYPFTQYTRWVHQAGTYQSSSNGPDGGIVDEGTGESQEQSYKLNQLEENSYKPIIIVMHKKYKLEQNDSGMFALSLKLDGNIWQPLNVLPHPECFDLDDFNEEVSDMLDQQYENKDPAPEISSEEEESSVYVTKLCAKKCENIVMGLSRISQENHLDPDEFLDMALQLEQYTKKMCLVSKQALVLSDDLSKNSE